MDEKLVYVTYSIIFDEVCIYVYVVFHVYLKLNPQDYS